MRALEGLEPEKAPAYGVLPEELKVELQGLTLRVDVVNGQKTGLFLDQEANRTLVRQFVFPGARVLDLFSYTGSWGLHAALQGAAEVTMVDSSQPALDRAREIAALNGLEDRITFMRDSVQVFLKRERAEWDMVILDPPAFIKSRAHITEGHKGYIDINRRALGKLAPGGIIVTCSCSHHLDQGLFEETLDTAARQSGKNLRVLAMGGQGPDHPYLLSMPETKYLKLIVAQAI
jgi:23S rRNA (cytosine1962-C5)-methyltransferase